MKLALFGTTTLSVVSLCLSLGCGPCNGPRALCHNQICVVETGDCLTLTVNNGAPTRINFGGNAPSLTLGNGAGFALTDELTGTTFQMNNFATTTVNVSSLVQSGASAAGITLSATTTALNDHLLIHVTLAKNGTGTRPVHLSYSLPFDATGWSWYDSPRKPRTIIAGTDFMTDVLSLSTTEGSLGAIDGINYRGKANLPPFNAYALSALANSSVGLAYGVPQNKPRSFYVHYDDASKTYQICFDLSLSDVTTNFVNWVDVDFVLYKLDQPAYGFRSALDKYWKIFSDEFVKSPAIHGATFDTFVLNGTLDPIHPQPLYKPSDFSFLYQWTSDGNKFYTGTQYVYYESLDAYFYKRDLSFIRGDATCPVDPLAIDAQLVLRNYFHGLLNDLGGNPGATVPLRDCQFSPQNPQNSNETCLPEQPGAGAPSFGCWRYCPGGDDSVCYTDPTKWVAHPLFPGKIERISQDGFSLKEAVCNALPASSQHVDGVNGVTSTTYNSILPCDVGYAACQIPSNIVPGTITSNCDPDSNGNCDSSFVGTVETTHLNASPFIPAPQDPLANGQPSGLCQGARNWGRLNIDTAIKFISGGQEDCVGIDTFGGFGAADFDTSHFPSVTVPLTYDPASKKPVVYTDFALFEFVQELRTELAQPACVVVMGPGTVSGGFLGNTLTASNGEIYETTLESTDRPTIDQTLNYLMRQRVLTRDKAYSTFIYHVNRNNFADDLELLATYGLFGFVADRSFWSSPPLTPTEITSYQSIEKVVEKLSEAHWRPLTFATPNDPSIVVERFGSTATGALYFTVRNTDPSTPKSVVIQLDLNQLGLGSNFTVTSLLENLGPDVNNADATISFHIFPAAKTTVLQIGQFDPCARCRDLTGCARQSCYCNCQGGSWQGKVLGDGGSLHQCGQCI